MVPYLLIGTIMAIYNNALVIFGARKMLCRNYVRYFLSKIARR